jgi:hypothetical protein
MMRSRGCLDRRLDDLDALGLEDGVECAGELGIAIADEEPELGRLVAEVEQEVAGLLGDPCGGWMRVTPSMWTRRVACSTTARQYSRASVMVSA